MRMSFLALALVGACAAPQPTASPSEASPAPSPSAPDSSAAVEVAIVGTADGGGRLLATLRGGGRIRLDRPARVLTPTGTFEAPPSPVAAGVEAPEFASGASYDISREARLAAEAAGARARVELHDGTAYRSHSVVRVDLQE